MNQFGVCVCIFFSVFFFFCSSSFLFLCVASVAVGKRGGAPLGSTLVPFSLFSNHFGVCCLLSTANDADGDIKVCRRDDRRRYEWCGHSFLCDTVLLLASKKTVRFNFSVCVRVCVWTRKLRTIWNALMQMLLSKYIFSLDFYDVPEWIEEK